MNTEPIQETQLNVHQLTDKLREMEELLIERDAQLNLLNARNTQLIDERNNALIREKCNEDEINYRNEFIRREMLRSDGRWRIDDFTDTHGHPFKSTTSYIGDDIVSIDELNKEDEEDEEYENERPLLTAWYKYINREINVNDFRDTLDRCRTMHHWRNPPIGHSTIKRSISPTHQIPFKAGLDINTRKQFTSHLCNN